MTNPLRLTLKDGSIESKQLVQGIQRKLEALIKNSPRAVWELAQHARNSSHVMLGSSKGILINSVLLATDGSLLPHVRNVVVNAIEGNSIESMQLVSPVKE